MKSNKVRMKWFRIYLILGLLLLSLFLLLSRPHLLVLLKQYFLKIIWASSWGAIGVSLGLYNSKTLFGGNSEKDEHYFTYFIFVWFIASIASFVLFENSEKLSVAYLASMLAGITIGFLGDKLAEKMPGSS